MSAAPPSVRTMHLIDSLTGGGAEQSLVELLPTMSAHGIHPSVVVLHSKDEATETRLRKLDIPVHVLCAEGRAGSVWRLRRLLRRERPELLHTSLFESDVIGRLAAVGTSTPVLTSLVNTSYDPVRQQDQHAGRARLAAVRTVDMVTAHLGSVRFHAISETVRDAAIRDLRLSPEEITVIPRGRDRHRLGEPGLERRRRVRRDLGIPESASVVLHVGREEFQKGHDVLLDAMETVLANEEDVILLLAGRSGAQTPTITRLLERLPTERVHRLGYVEEIGDLFASADLFVFPSRYEGLGGVLLEAMAMEVPVVASDLAVLRETLGDAAAFVVPGSSPALRDEVRRLLHEPEQRSLLAATGRRRFAERFDHGHVTAEMARLFRECAGHRLR